MKIFENVASMKLAHLREGQLIETKGYYEAGDGGQGRYLIAPAQTVDGYVDHTLANGNVALLQYEGALNVKQAGAKGDYDASTGTGTDDTAAIQAAVDTGATTMCNATYYIGTSLVHIAHNLSDGEIVSDSSTGCCYISSDYIKVSNVAFSTTVKSDYVLHLDNVEGVQLSSIKLSSPDSIGVRCYDCDRCTFDKITYTGSATTGYAVLLDGCLQCKITNSHGTEVTHGFLIVGESQAVTSRTLTEHGENIINDCSIDTFDGHAFDINGSNRNHIDNCIARNYTGVSNHNAFQNKNSLSSVEAKFNTFSNCSSYNVGNGFGTQEGSGVIFSNMVVEEAAGYGCLINSTDYVTLNNILMIDVGIDGVNYSNSYSGNINGLTVRGTGLSGNVINTVNADKLSITGLTLLDTFSTPVINIDSNSFAVELHGNFTIGSNTIADSSSNTVYHDSISFESSFSTAGTQYKFNMPNGFRVQQIQAYVTSDFSDTGQCTISCGSTTLGTLSPAGDRGTSIVGTSNGLLAVNDIVRVYIGTTDSTGVAYITLSGIRYR
jgi:hypothetical protein